MLPFPFRFGVAAPFDQKPPINGIPIIDIEPNIIAVDVTGILDAIPPILRIS